LQTHVVDNRKQHYALWTVAVVTYAFGILLPCFKVRQGAGGVVTEFLFTLVFGASFDSHTLSILDGIIALFREGRISDIALGLVLFSFSVLFPIWKLGVLFMAISNNGSSKTLALAAKLGKWSMAEVFAVIVIVLQFKQFPGGTSAMPDIGCFIYLASVLYSGALASVLTRH